MAEQADRNRNNKRWNLKNKKDLEFFNFRSVIFEFFECPDVDDDESCDHMITSPNLNLPHPRPLSSDGHSLSRTV